MRRGILLRLQYRNHAGCSEGAQKAYSNFYFVFLIYPAQSSSEAAAALASECLCCGRFCFVRILLNSSCIRTNIENRFQKKNVGPECQGKKQTNNRSKTLQTEKRSRNRSSFIAVMLETKLVPTVACADVVCVNVSNNACLCVM